MSPDQSDAQRVDLGQKRLDAFVFCDPRSDLVKEIEGNVNGARLAIDLEGEVPGPVQRSALTAMATVSAAVLGGVNQAGGQDRLACGQPAQPTVQHAANLRRMLRHAHVTVQQGDREFYGGVL